MFVITLEDFRREVARWLTHWVITKRNDLPTTLCTTLGFVFIDEMQNGAIWGHFRVSYNIESSTILMTLIDKNFLKCTTLDSVNPVLYILL
jgi:hypothetical protein